MPGLKSALPDPISDLSSLKSALSSLKSALAGLKSALPWLKSLLSDLQSILTGPNSSLTGLRFTLSDLGPYDGNFLKEKKSVSPYFLHHFLDNSRATMILKDKVSLKTLDVYISIIF